MSRRVLLLGLLAVSLCVALAAPQKRKRSVENEEPAVTKNGDGITLQGELKETSDGEYPDDNEEDYDVLIEGTMPPEPVEETNNESPQDSEKEDSSEKFEEVKTE
ncbi:glycoprotein UL22A [Panine betaherpesvirus 2]|uniref:Glycoprotein UL22A n=1 Tax=Panine betaherpesvirus 2 TaxID=188763 RepID=Q8QS66_9BETA|nr:glycoprotein UL22A [Panine betaherpesvirus 2]AAM00672.1 glycoprotein UL22A [Panine betaherpesvirus 2]QXV67774.1 glycoprotein UL22A [Panine betaherpesvirus 2]